ncbi:MAG: PH domain-containing protein [Actinobacteria bacterium]|nr:PH domain-containing protein [Actinomycetota bacterium]
MGYPQKLLSDGESVEFEMRPHWRALIVPGIILAIVVFGAAFLLTKLGEWFTANGFIDTFGSWVIWLIAIFIMVVWVIRPFLYWITTQYVFTNRRIIVRTGLISRQGRDMPLSKVNNVSFDVTFFGRILNYGLLTIDSASDEALVINDVPSVERIQREVNRLHEEDDERRRKQFARDMSPPPDEP